VPLWTILIACVCAAWSLAGNARRVPLPGKYLRIAIALALVAAVLGIFRTLNGLDAGTALLTAMGSVKLLETNTRRDRYVVIAAALYLLLAAALDAQDLPLLPIYAAHAWLCSAALAVSAHPESPLGGRAAGRLAARTLLLALPLAIFVFLFFPRLAGSLWALPEPGRAVTGLSDTLTPGAISDLIESPVPAFRVWFDGAPPPPNERYWRGPVLDDFDGSTWSRPPPWWFGPPRTLQPLGRAYHYRLTLEPTEHRWGFALDTVAWAPRALRVRLTADHVLVSARPLVEAVTYEAVSYPHARDADPLPARVRARDMRLPPGRNPRTLALAHRLRAEARGDAAFVDAALEFLRNGGFHYTLTPPRLSGDQVDELLFDTRQGFCGHYASAFATLMRAGGVPARIVTGYLGGEWNPIGGYLLLRQSDAHAWVEVWLAGRGWTRIDPTAVVAPERLTHDVLDLLPGAASPTERLILDLRWLTSLGQAWDAANAWWTSTVIDFDLSSQLALLARLGVRTPGLGALTAIFALALGVWLAANAWHHGRPSPARRPDRLARAYSRLCRRLAHAGTARALHEGPLAYADSIARRNPQLARRVRPLLEEYAALRYGADSSSLEARRVAEFQRAVARWRPREPPRRRHLFQFARFR
ncbi:MAG: transglutaminase TgpA family protein, partial [Steroidobacteraceae bacterium]